MSLGEWERRALAAIEAGLARSDPGLAALLRVFSRLVSGEAMPVRGKIRALRRGAARRGSAARRRARQPAVALMRAASPSPRQGWLLAAPLLWLVVSVGLITVALALSTGDRGSEDCTPSMGVVCGQQAAAPGPVDGLVI